MTLHEGTFQYLSPTLEQTASMGFVRKAFTDVAAAIDGHIPEGPDKTCVMRKLREAAMWANIAITRQADGSPRK